MPAAPQDLIGAVTGNGSCRSRCKIYISDRVIPCVRDKEAFAGKYQTLRRVESGDAGTTIDKSRIITTISVFDKAIVIRDDYPMMQ